MEMFDLEKYIKAQKNDYKVALSEIKAGKKQSHWVWYIFPQINGLGHSETSQYYSLQNIDEAKAYLNNTYLYNNLIEICTELLRLKCDDIQKIMGFPDNLKLCSSMTLFHLASPNEKVFKQVLDKFYNGKLDENTIKLCNKNTMDKINHKNKDIKSNSGIIGLAVGDAMGVPLEFCIREKLIHNPTTRMLGYGSHDVPKGSWSDDSSMTLATIDAIVNDNCINCNTIANNFLEWMNNAKYTPNDRVFDIGRTCLRAIAKFESKQDIAEQCGGTSEMDNGNGSMMRILPLVYYCYAKKMEEKDIFEIVKKVSSITHGHEISIMGCFIYVMYGIELLNNKNLTQAYKKIKKIKYNNYFSEETIIRYERIIKNKINKYSLDEIKSTGFIIDTLEATLWVLLNTTSYNQAIIGAINLGNDTDTVGACTGGLAGIYYGYNAINEEWKNDLLRKDYIEELCHKFDNVLNSF